MTLKLKLKNTHFSAVVHASIANANLDFCIKANKLRKVRSSSPWPFFLSVILIFCAAGIFPPREVQHGEEIRVGTDICINSSMSIYFFLLCDVRSVNLTERIRTALPTPNRTWTMDDPDNMITFSTPINADPLLNPAFFESGLRQLLLPGLVGHPLLIAPSGELIISIVITQNLTNQTLLPDLPSRDAGFIRGLVISEILGTYTCLVENEYGCDTATTTIYECGKQNQKCIYHRSL